jgi:hypothetical protein
MLSEYEAREYMMHVLRSRLGKFLIWAGCSVLFAVPINASNRPTWAKQATAFSCSPRGHRIESPDRRWSIEVVCPTKEDDDPTYSLRVYQGAQRVFDALPLSGARELLWAPDSKAFFVNGSQAGYWGFFVTVYELTPDGLREHVITDLAMRDMLASFPPCRAVNIDETGCAEILKDPGYNMSGVGWANDSRSVFVFAEVPPGGGYGGIAGQVLGYRLSVPDGRIVKRLSAPQVKTEWRDLMKWHMHIPDPPEYRQPLPH